MTRGVLLAAIWLVAGGVPAAVSAASLWEPPQQRPADVLPPLPLPPAQHADIPPLPPGSTGFVRDPRTGQYTANDGKAIWVPGHWQSGDSGRLWVEGQWMYQVPPKEGYGR